MQTKKKFIGWRWDIGGSLGERFVSLAPVTVNVIETRSQEDESHYANGNVKNLVYFTMIEVMCIGHYSADILI